MNEDKAMKRRALKYLIPGLGLSIIFNIPKFFEAKVTYPKMEDYDFGNMTDAEIESVVSCVTFFKKIEDVRNKAQFLSTLESWPLLVIN